MFVDTQRVRRILDLAAAETRVQPLRIWLQRDEFGGLEKLVRELLTEFEAKAAEMGRTGEQVDRETALYVLWLATEAMLRDAKKRPQKISRRR